MKHLPKHLRPRWRYLAVSIESWPGAGIDRDSFQRALWYSGANLLGETGSAELDLSVLGFRFGVATGEAVVRVRRGEVDRARAVIACLDEVDGDPVGVRVAGVSGTIRACEEKYMRRGREGPDKRSVAFGGATRSASIRSGRVDVEVDGAYTGATNLDCE